MPKKKAKKSYQQRLTAAIKKQGKAAAPGKKSKAFMKSMKAAGKKMKKR